MTGRREDRNRIPRALVGFSNALLVTGDRSTSTRWRDMIDVRQRATRGGRTAAPNIRRCTARTAGMAGSASRGVSARSRLVLVDARRRPVARAGANPWVEFLEGKNPGYPETALRARPGEHSAQARGHACRPHAARQASRRQHARPESGGDRRAGAADARRAGAGPRRRAAQRPLRYFDPGAPSRRRAGGRRCARLGTRRSAHGRDAGESQRDRSRAR